MSKRADILKRDGKKCVKCGSTSNLTLDHIVPKSKGGCNQNFNLQTICKICNGRKGSNAEIYIQNKRSRYYFEGATGKRKGVERKFSQKKVNRAKTRCERIIAFNKATYAEMKAAKE